MTILEDLGPGSHRVHSLLRPPNISEGPLPFYRNGDLSLPSVHGTHWEKGDEGRLRRTFRTFVMKANVVPSGRVSSLIVQPVSPP